MWEIRFEHFVHGIVVLKVGQIDIALEAFFHRRSGAFQLLLDGLENLLGVHRNVARLVVSHARYENQIAVGDRAAEQRRILGLLAVAVDDPLGGLLLCLGGGDGGGGDRRGSGCAASKKLASIGCAHRPDLSGFLGAIIAFRIGSLALRIGPCTHIKCNTRSAGRGATASRFA